MISRIRLAAALQAAGIVLLAGCSDPTAPQRGPAAQLQGTAPVLTAGQAAADSLSIRVVDSRGRAVRNAQVTFSASPGGMVSISPASSVSDASGRARAALTAGTRAGPVTVRAVVTALDSTASLDIAFVVKAGPAHALQQGSDTVATVAGATHTLRLVDAYGNLADAAGAAWTSSNGAVALVSTSGVVTARALGGTAITAQVGQRTMVSRFWVVPPTLNSCETNTATLCTTWAFDGGKYNATWTQGSVAVITVRRFDADSVAFSRVDPSGSSVGMRAEYRGARQPSGVADGRVTWTPLNATFSFSGAWTSTW